MLILSKIQANSTVHLFERPLAAAVATPVAVPVLNPLHGAGADYATVAGAGLGLAVNNGPYALHLDPTLHNAGVHGNQVPLSSSLPPFHLSILLYIIRHPILNHKKSHFISCVHTSSISLCIYVCVVQ